MIKFYAHSLFSITFFVVRFFILDAAASPAYAKAQMHEPNLAMHVQAGLH